MKAIEVIDQLTRNSDDECIGTFTANSVTNMTTYLGQLFGKNYKIIFDRGNILLPLEKERCFLYIYDKRLDRAYDKDILAILSVYNYSLVYLYEIE